MKQCITPIENHFRWKHQNVQTSQTSRGRPPESGRLIARRIAGGSAFASHVDGGASTISSVQPIPAAEAAECRMALTCFLAMSISAEWSENDVFHSGKEEDRPISRFFPFLHKIMQKEKEGLHFKHLLTTPLSYSFRHPFWKASIFNRFKALPLQGFFGGAFLGRNKEQWSFQGPRLKR